MDKIKENYKEQFLVFKDFFNIFETFFTLISSKLFFSDKFKDFKIQDEKSLNVPKCQKGNLFSRPTLQIIQGDLEKNQHYV